MIFSQKAIFGLLLIAKSVAIDYQNFEIKADSNYDGDAASKMDYTDISNTDIDDSNADDFDYDNSLSMDSLEESNSELFFEEDFEVEERGKLPKNFILAKKAGIKGAYIVVMKEDNEAELSTYTAETLESFAFEVAEMTGSSIEVQGVYTSALKGFTVTGLSRKAAMKYAEDERVAFVEQDSEVNLETTWGLDRIDQPSLPLNRNYSPFSGRDGSGVYAYIIDTGIRITHTEFRNSSGQRRASWGTNTVDRTNTDCNGHGTHVAGTVGGRAYGVAKNVNLVAVKVLNCRGSGSWSSVIGGINWVKSHARGKKATANLSLGGGASSAVDYAVRNLHRSGVVTVVAAGNSGRNACGYSPAREGSVITVGATASNDYRASFSNYGNCLDIFAPGQSITSAWHTGDTAGKTISGTSMASPHVCGAAALYLQNGSSAGSVESVIKNGSTKNRVRNAGSGSPNMLLYVGGGSNPTPAPTRAPAPGPSCISGDTGVLTKAKDSFEESVTQVRDLKVGDIVPGLDSNKKETSCTVEAIGNFGTGEVYGNYTSDHFLYNYEDDIIEENGVDGGKMKETDKYDLIADCPVVKDESGKFFGPMDSDFCGGRVKNMSWTNYLRLHKAILNVVRESGGFWFQSSSYKDMKTVKKFAPSVCKNMLRCMKNSNNCQKLEKASQKFIDNALTDSAKAETLKTFTNIGSRCQMGSVSAVVTSNESVDASLINTANC